MPRKYELTWQPGSGGRKGRLRKKYHGQAYLGSATLAFLVVVSPELQRSQVTLGTVRGYTI